MPSLKVLPAFLLMLLLAPAPGLRAETTPEAEAAWKTIESANTAPKLPPSWEKTPPKDQSIVKDTLRAETERLLTVAEQARNFASKYPQDPRRQAARQIATKALMSAERLGSPTARIQLAAVDGERLGDPTLPVSERLDVRMRQVQSEAEALAQKNPDDARDRFEQGARRLIQEFPKESTPWAMLMEVIDQGNDAPTKLKLKEIIASADAPEPIKKRAAGVLHRYDALGQQIELKFTALDGHTVDLAALRGKVVIVHFWATWCEPCVDAIGTMAKAYAALKDLGVEVIGINLDSDKATVEKFVKEHGVAWPQFFDPEGTNNRIVREWGVTTFPAMWLIDQKGVLRDLTGQMDLTRKIEGLLSEGATPAVPGKK